MAWYDKYTGDGSEFNIEDLFKLYLTPGSLTSPLDYDTDELDLHMPMHHEGYTDDDGVFRKYETPRPVSKDIQDQYQSMISPYLFRELLDTGKLPGIQSSRFNPNYMVEKILGNLDYKKLGVDKKTLKTLSDELGYTVSPGDALLMSGGLAGGHPGRGPTEAEMIAAREKYDLGRGAIDKIRNELMQKDLDIAEETFEKKIKSKGPAGGQAQGTTGGANVGAGMFDIKKKDAMKNKNLKTTMGGEEQRNYESKKRYWDKFKPKKEEPFVDKKTFLEKIMDKRIKPGEELSNAAKTRLYLKEISQNLLERRKKGGKEGTDTLARIFGGIREGEEAVTAKEEGIVIGREAAKDKRLKRDKTVADITRVYAETTKLQSEALKQDFPEEWQMFALEAAANNLKPGSQPFNDYIVKNLQQKRLLATGKGAGDMYTKLAELLAQLSFTPPGDARDQLQANIDNLRALMPGLGTTGNQTENNQSSQSQTELMKDEEE